MTDRPIFHQIINTDPTLGYDGRPVVSSTDLPEGHQPAKLRNNRRQVWVGGEQVLEILNRGPVARVPREGMMVDQEPMN